ncbi:acyl-CoA N-acyltransferase [Microstroma glucosiphilum]|uniref:Acyl-CoA N-acyltransferase n=1 Tax=Pseudomicrostroma glucosiphilum TaxID=1684307 RepID=A0A316UBC8_9BASI|nr:acyl-CoA N-acyltransferase [Pseudomicrostroma glucosiphilum]PWN22168.1 acyl-CoA N-acyltransferase [Pseudomicrostroma glucosiphilum]
MSRLRPFKCTDLFHFNRVNLDHFTETYSTAYYLNYLATWPDLCFVSTHASCSESTASSDGAVGRAGGGDTQIMGYLFGKAEGIDGAGGTKEKERHGHVTAVTVGPEFRRLGLARELMGLLEEASSLMYSAYFIDLFVRPSNALAVGLYQSLDYAVHRVVKEYYQGGGPGGSDEDGYDMRKALPRDTKRETVRESSKGMKVFVEQ